MMIPKEGIAPRIASAVDKAVGDLVTREEIDQCTALLVSQLSEISYSGYLFPRMNESPLKILEAVAQRIALCSYLDAAPPLGFQKRALKIYLLLTCFDMLGQSADWLPFGHWLHSKKPEHVTERVHVVEGLDKGLGPESISAALYTEYNKIYSVRSGFFRFLFEILPAEWRHALFNNIRIIKRPYAPGKSDPLPISDQQKAEWLYGIRNEYTHSGSFVPHPDFFDPEIRTGSVMYKQEFKGQYLTAVFVSKWPDILMMVVRIGLVVYLRALLPHERADAQKEAPPESP